MPCIHQGLPWDDDGGLMDGLPDGVEDNGTGTDKNGKVDDGETDPTDPDTDGDLIPDGIEDTNKNGVYDDTVCPTCPGGYETDPTHCDTDGDGLLDGWEDADLDGTWDEVDDETHPRKYDTDGDNLADGYNRLIGGVFYLGEMTAGTNPLNPDTDGDGVDDEEELTPGTDGYETNPLFSDTDYDGIDDDVEIACNYNGLSYCTSPVNHDTDGDGLSDKIEMDGWTVFIILTKKNNAGKNKLDWHVSSDPTVQNSDDDELNDLSEFTNATDPTKKDTDSDTIPDCEEVEKYDGDRFHPFIQYKYAPKVKSATFKKVNYDDIYCLVLTLVVESDVRNWDADGELTYTLLGNTQNAGVERRFCDKGTCTIKMMWKGDRGYFDAGRDATVSWKIDLTIYDNLNNRIEEKYEIDCLLDKLADALVIVGTIIYDSFVMVGQAIAAGLATAANWIWGVIEYLIATVVEPIVNMINNYVTGLFNAIDNALIEYINNMRSPGWVSEATKENIGKAFLGVLYDPLMLILNVIQTISSLTSPILIFIEGGIEAISTAVINAITSALNLNGGNDPGIDAPEETDLNLLSTIFSVILLAFPGFLSDGKLMSQDTIDNLNLPNDGSLTDFQQAMVLIIVNSVLDIWGIILLVVLREANDPAPYPKLLFGTILSLCALIIISGLKSVVNSKKHAGADTSFAEMVIKAITILAATIGLILTGLGAAQSGNLYAGILAIGVLISWLVTVYFATR